MVVATVLFLFFCLFLDAFCWICFGGWQPLLGQWPIFSGSVSLAYFGENWKVIILGLGLAGTARIILGKKVPWLVAYLFEAIEKSREGKNGTATNGKEVDKE